MKIKELFEYVDEVMENVFSEKVKLRWLNQIEAELQVDVLLLQAEGIVQYTMEDLEDPEKTLLAPPPYDELYAEYLQYRICLAQEEPERANNKVATFNRAYHEFARFVAETANPGEGMAELRRYYLRGERGERGIQGERGDPGLTMEYDEETETLIIDIAPSTGSSGSDGDGEDSETGMNTVGITSIEQTVTSEEDGGINEIKATMSDGATSVFRIRNGSKGSAGDSFVSLTYNANTGKWVQMINSGGNLIETEVDGPAVCSKEEIDAMFGSYVDDVAEIVGGEN